MEERGLERLRTLSGADSITGLGLSVGPAMAVEDSKPASRTPPPRVHRLELMPFRPVARVGALPTSISSAAHAGSPFPWLITNGCRDEVTVAEAHSVSGLGRGGIDVNQVPCATEYDDASAYRADAIRVVEGGPAGCVKREREKASDLDLERDRTCDVSSRTSDEDEIGSTRKKLRLSKEQSALLEESFREHSTLNPQKQKNALAKQLNLRPRQVEVWFQNRRARTKLKQTEVDCELLKRCCETLTEENRRLQKELQELRALKTAPPCVIGHDLYMPLPATTLTMCPSCERVATMDSNRNLTFSKPQISQFAQQSAAC